MFDYDESKSDALTICEGQIKTILTDAYDKGLENGYRLAREQKPVEDEWIPCSERLPDESNKQIMLHDEHTSDFVLVVIKGQTYPFPKTKIRIGRYSYTCKDWQIPNNNLGKVIAWMPLPDPPKGEDNE